MRRALGISHLSPVVRGAAFRHAFRDHLGGFSWFHRDTVEHVGCFHRLLLVRDHHELNALS